MTDMSRPTYEIESLCRLVTKRFETARRSQSLLFSNTELAIIRSKKDVPFQLRYCPSLAKKPGAVPKADSKPEPDPFENPHPDLFIGELRTPGGGHILVLNKYPVIPNHFILATKLNKPQTALLESVDLHLAYSCVYEWPRTGPEPRSQELFAFFNSGEHSGASQPHRHVQFLPVDDMRQGSGSGWDVLLNRMQSPAHPTLPLLHDPSLPFVHYATMLDPHLAFYTLHEKYIMLLKAAMDAVRESEGVSGEAAEIEKDGHTTISYNLAMIRDKMAICPRRSESARIGTSPSGNLVAINGTILGGTLMVKEEQDWQCLRNDPSLLDDMLASIGYPLASTISHEPNKL